MRRIHDALILVVALTALLSIARPETALANAATPAACTLPPSQNDDVYSDLGEPVQVDLKTTLAQTEAAQVIAAAQTFARDWNEPVPSTLEAAISYLMDASEAGDVYLLKPTINGVAYTFVEYFPGGNPYGVFFLGDTSVEMAQMHDSDVVCTETAPLK